MDLDILIIPLGILTYAMVIATIISGLRMINIKHHKLLAYLTISLATFHAVLVLIYFFGK